MVAHCVAGLLLPVLGEGLVEVDVQLARRVVRHVEQLVGGVVGQVLHREEHGGHHDRDDAEHVEPRQAWQA